MPTLAELLARKRLIEQKLRTMLGSERARKAASDHHARRRPRPCGLTVHVVLGCTGRCAYCYITDMGVSYEEARPYALSPEELTYAILVNKHFLPGRWGTYLALGSIGEPFHPLGARKTLNYIHTFTKYLGNPIQFSTKMLTPEMAAEFSKYAKQPLSPLITIVKLKAWKTLEPGALPPDTRFETIKALRKSGLYPSLFLRPVIPGINTDELEDILREAKRAGAASVVIGGFRVTPLILNRLKQLGFDVSQILARVDKSKLAPKVQVPVPLRDLKEHVASIAKEIGLIPLFNACCANTLSSYFSTGERVPCAGLCFTKGGACSRCPVKCWEIEVKVDEEDVVRWARTLGGIEAKRVEVLPHKIVIRTDNPRHARNRLKRTPLRTLIETAYRRRLEVG